MDWNKVDDNLNKAIDRTLKLINPRTVAMSVAKSVAKKAIESDYWKNKFLVPHYTSKIANNTYMITEAMLFNSYLFIGKERALLIDTGIGVSGLLDEVKKFTDKPLIVVATHSHISSVGGAGEFDEVYIHKKDLKDARRYNSYWLRKLAFKAVPTRFFLDIDEDCLTKEKGKFIPLGKKQREFDLGGRKIKIIHTPSHTMGSCCFVDSDTDITITGHVTTPVSVMILPHATTISKYAETFESLMEYLKDRRNYSGVWIKPLSYERTCDLRDLADESVGFSNDYTRFIRFRFSLDKRRLLIYYPAKTLRRSFWTRIRTL